MTTTRSETTKIKKVMTEKYSNSYRIGHKDGYDETISKMHDILGKCYNTGYKDAMDFVCEWMTNFKNSNGEFPLYDFVGNLRKAMEEQICNETSK